MMSEEKRTCATCGRTLGIGFYFVCHYCGMAYCYAHAPPKCKHEKAKVAAAAAVIPA